MALDLAEANTGVIAAAVDKSAAVLRKSRLCIGYIPYH
ncbi:hypothetical protein SOHN41_01190 [Shewanella sp. HN-41]|nr:hypothetical protein SOHN41_01190 [Shewanella sp. HN-41]